MTIIPASYADVESGRLRFCFQKRRNKNEGEVPLPAESESNLAGGNQQREGVKQQNDRYTKKDSFSSSCWCYYV